MEIRLFIVFVILLSFIACGGGGGGGGNDDPPDPPPANNAPSIELIASESVNEGEYLSITASASDSDGTISSYQWSQVSGVNVELDDDDESTVSFYAPPVDNDTQVTLRITVTDNDGATASQDVVITVVNSLYSSSPHRVNFMDDQDLDLFYNFFDHRVVSRIEIITTQTEWNAFINELESNLHSDVYFKANVSITVQEIDEGEVEQETETFVIEDTGFRIRGNTTRQLPEQNGEFKPVHFKLKFNEPFDLDPDSLAYLDRQERRFANLRGLNLKSRRPGYDDSQIRELYAYDLFNQIGVKAPLTGSAHVYLTIGSQTIDYGYYTAIEPIDKTFLRKRFGDENNESNLYKCLWKNGGPATLAPKHPDVSMNNWIGVSDILGFDPSYDLKTNKSTADFSDLTTFIDQLDTLNGDALASYLDQNFEIESFLKYLAMNVLIGNPDDYWAMGNNYYLYFNENGKIEFFPYDYDKAFGGGTDFETIDANIYEWYNRSGPMTGDPHYDAHPLVDKVLVINKYRTLYESYLAQYTDQVLGNFNHAAYSEKFNALKRLYDADNNGQLDSDINDNVPWMNNDQESYFEMKINFVRDQLGLE